jgi:hypothetical protein
MLTTTAAKVARGDSFEAGTTPLYRLEEQRRLQGNLCPVEGFASLVGHIGYNPPARRFAVCIFSGPVRHVANTRIFARLSRNSGQCLVYSMQYEAQQDLAMILPLPVALPAAQASIRFLNLISYSRFFDDLDSGFPQPAMPAAAGGVPPAPGSSRGFLPIEVVGDFVATFVPTLADFRRVDPQFKLPLWVWGQIPIYQDYGFAVFQLRARQAPTKVHPMALVFRTRMPKALFLPTVHIHDGKVHPTETFDHSLYVQDSRLRPSDQRNSFGDPANMPAKEILIASRSVAKGFMDIRRTQGIVEPDEIALKRELRGVLPNKDTIIPCETV